MNPSPEHSAQLNRRLARVAKEFKVVCLRESPLADDLHVCETPEQVERYWHAHIATAPNFTAEVESCYVLMLDSRRHPKGHHLVATGTLDTILVHPREVFRAAAISGASAIILTHNHPSGDPTPSDNDIKATGAMYEAGILMGIEVLDHVIIGRVCGQRKQGYYSLKEFHYFVNFDRAIIRRNSAEARVSAKKPRPRVKLRTPGDPVLNDLVPCLA